MKEYDDRIGKLIFEGEYLNGKRNGKGKEYYYDGKLIFEGEYINGKKNGKGKKYNIYGQLEFEGEYLNDKIHGKGNKYNSIGDLEFEGEFFYGKEKKGKKYIKNKLEFEGDYKKGKKWNGKGYDEDGNVIYELNNGSGKIKEYNKNNELIFEGELLNGKRNGKGKEYKYGELIFEGEYLKGEKWNGKFKDFISKSKIYGEYIYLNCKKNRLKYN